MTKKDRGVYQARYSQGNYQIVKRIGDNSTVLASVPSAGFLDPLSMHFSMGLEIDDPTIRLIVNGMEVASVTDTWLDRKRGRRKG